MKIELIEYPGLIEYLDDNCIFDWQYTAELGPDDKTSIELNLHFTACHEILRAASPRTEMLKAYVGVNGSNLTTFLAATNVTELITAVKAAHWYQAGYKNNLLAGIKRDQDKEKYLTRNAANIAKVVKQLKREVVSHTTQPQDMYLIYGPVACTLHTLKTVTGEYKFLVPANFNL